jgi:hypothetical protein
MLLRVPGFVWAMHGEPLRWKVTLKSILSLSKELTLNAFRRGLCPDPQKIQKTRIKGGAIVSLVSLATLELFLADPMPQQPSLS